MTVSGLLKYLEKIKAAGHGDIQIFYRHSASGDCGPIGTPYVTNRVDDFGPFDLEGGEVYLALSVGH
jgi:hypothetical protein